MTTYKVSGITTENAVPSANTIILYKADRLDFTTIGEEITRGTAQADGKFELTYQDWDREVMVIALDPEDTSRYDGAMVDWLVGEVVGSDPHIEDVVILSHMEGANGGTAFLDEMGNVMTAVENAVTSTAQAKFGSSAAAFDGVGLDRLVVTRSAAMSLGPSDFCMEWWVYQNTSTGLQTICSKRINSDYGEFVIRTNVGVVEVWFRTGTSSWTTDQTSGTPPIGQWYHLAVSREDSDFRVFIDGTETSLFTSALAVIPDTNDIHLGSNSDDTAPLDGYIDDFRLTVGKARYTADFIPPTAAHPNDIDIHFSKVVSLLHMDGAEDGTSFPDVIGNVVTRTDNPTTTADQVRSGTASADFTGNWDQLVVAYDPSMNPGSSDFTAECWVYSTDTTPSWSHLLSKAPDTVTAGDWDINVQVGYLLDMRFRTADGVETITSGDSYPLNEWFHVAGVRYGDTFMLFLNGALVADAINPNPIISSTDAFKIGTDTNQAASNTNIYIDEVRYTVGVARYTKNFTPRLLAFPDA